MVNVAQKSNLKYKDNANITAQAAAGRGNLAIVQQHKAKIEQSQAKEQKQAEKVHERHQKKKDDGLHTLASDVCRHQRQHMPVQKNHPLKGVLVMANRPPPAQSLEAWLDSGVAKGPEGFAGMIPLPTGYEGAKKGKILVKAANNGVKIYPIRVDVGDCGADDMKPYTLYHFTNRASFEKWLSMATRSKEADYMEHLFSILKEDYQERVPAPHPQNMKGDPQMTPVEPTKFQRKKDILIHMFGHMPKGYSRTGQKYEDMADFCIPIRCPASCCFDILGVAAQATIKLDRDGLEALRKRVDTRRNIARARAARAAEEERLRRAQREGCIRRCCRFLCCATMEEKDGNVPEFWDELDGNAMEMELEAEEREREARKLPREVDYWKANITNKFVKEHLAEVTKRQEENTRRIQAETRHQMQTIQQKLMALKGTAVNTVQMGKGAGANVGVGNSAEAEIADMTRQLAQMNMGGEGQDAQVDVLADRFLGFGSAQRMEATTEIARSANAKLKMKRTVNLEAMAPRGRMRRKKGEKLTAEQEAEDRRRTQGGIAAMMEALESPKGEKKPRAFGAKRAMFQEELEEINEESEGEEDEDRDGDEKGARAGAEGSPRAEGPKSAMKSAMKSALSGRSASPRVASARSGEASARNKASARSAKSNASSKNSSESSSASESSGSEESEASGSGSDK